MGAMNEAIPTVRLRNPWRSNHPWIFQKLVDKPVSKPKPGSVVDIVGIDGDWIGRGFYNGHSRIALRILETDRGVDVDAAWFARRIAAAVALRREVLQLYAISDAWRVVHSEGDGLSGLVVDRYGDLLVVEYFSAGMFRHREWIYDALRAQFPGCRFHAFADEHVQKQESFDFRGSEPAAPAIITEHGIRFRADLLREPRRVDRFVGVGGEHAQGDARMAVVEPAADPGAGVVHDVDDAARLGLHGGLVHHLLEDPGMVRAPLDAQAHDRQGGIGFHPAIVRGRSLPLHAPARQLR